MGRFRCGWGFYEWAGIVCVIEGRSWCVTVVLACIAYPRPFYSAIGRYERFEGKGKWVKMGGWLSHVTCVDANPFITVMVGPPHVPNLQPGNTDPVVAERLTWPLGQLRTNKRKEADREKITQLIDMLLFQVSTKPLSLNLPLCGGKCVVNVPSSV